MGSGGNGSGDTRGPPGSCGASGANDSPGGGATTSLRVGCGAYASLVATGTTSLGSSATTRPGYVGSGALGSGG